MLKVHFYILEIESKQRSLLFACQLIEKAYTEKKRVFIHTGSQSEAERIDALLWTYREDSFIPHQIAVANEAHPPLIQIGFGEAPGKQTDILINLYAEVPAFLQEIQEVNEVIEIVFSDPNVQQLARARYKQYRDLGFDINTYKLKANEL